ncbi:MAG TPA: hybrid sensor histidine kinase/response regulator [bacterium]|nr:hybrid sensor histidine kinase/response regulator [bacterium]
MDEHVAQKKKIVFIDNKSAYRKIAKEAFQSTPYECVICKTGQDGLNTIASVHPDLVVVEAFPPDMSGEEIYLQFLSNPEYRNLRKIPFIVLTENGHVDRSRLYGMGFSACMRKPFKARELIEFVEDALVSHQIKMEEMYCWETIREAKDFLERVVETSLDAIVTTDNGGIITYCNRACEEMLGYSFQELIGKRVSQFLVCGASELLKISAYLRKRNQLQNYKTVIIGNRNQKVSINLSLSTMRDSEGKVMGALGIAKETGGEKFAEYDSLASGRLATVVETAVAVNHAVNNPLVPILGNAQFLLQDDRLMDEDIRRRLRVIVKNALRIRDITQKLASISHPVTKEYLKGTRMLDIDAST